ncbi:MAG TPA: patatin-like phospholipase family protein [Sphingobacteriaceae bacterium]
MNIGVVLSGGGVRGVAHLGVLKALSEAGIKFCRITGTSAGAIVGSLFAEGHDPFDIFQIFLKTRLLRFMRPALGAGGLLSLQNTTNLFREYLPHNSFEGLKIPVTITTTNFSTGKLVYFSSGELIPVIQASCSIPGVFRPVIINDEMHVDGGVLNNFPVEPLLNNCDFIIGSSCNHVPFVKRITNFRRMIQRATLLAINADMKEKRGFCNLLIEPDSMGGTHIFDIGKAEELYWLAYEATLKELKSNEILQRLIKEELSPLTRITEN